MIKIKFSFTLIELIVVIAIIAILAAVIAPNAFRAIEKAKVARTVGLAKNLKTACVNFYADNGKYAYEWGDEATVSEPNHHLYYKPGSAYVNWDGPYIEKVLRRVDNPWGGRIVRVMNNTSNLQTGSGAQVGFDLDSDGTADVGGEGNFLLLSNITRSQGLMINNAFDLAAGLGETDWEQQGRSEWRLYSDADNVVCIYLVGGN